MEAELIDHPFNPRYINELYDCSFESDSSFPTSDLFTPCTTIVDQNSGHECLESLDRLLQIEAQLMDIDSSIIESDAVGVGGVVDSEFASYTSEQAQENVHVPAEGISLLKEIQIDLLEESSLTELLFAGAEAVEAENWVLASNIIAKLNTLLLNLLGSENGDNSFNKLAMFFSQGLHYKTCNSPEFPHEQAVSRSADTMSSFQMLQELSPYVKFAHFTANQAILEATQQDVIIHVIDFEIMEGSQWPSLMVDLAMRKGSRCASLRVTAITVDQQSAALAQQTGRRLKEFSETINLSFVFDQIMMAREEDLTKIEVAADSVIANCMVHQLHMPNRSISLVKTFLGGMRKLSPKLIVLVQEELFNFSKMPSMFFVEFFTEALHHYNSLCDSLVASFSGEYKTGLKQIEKEVLGVKILESVRQFPCEKEERMLWEECFASLKGFKSIPLSSCNVSQSKYLVSLFSRGYWVQHEKGRLSLCWKSRPLTTASVWVPLQNQGKLCHPPLLCASKV
ncbi:protein NODULATION SIGNALING PATHWAY 2-like [Argentina anserina]|uniref:protein NODULATION SIGNALING PATHWAY 2-like n=1 Tax=Argentina anserina TaxID=57926 RepID=UPI0021764134|nr:protein NODULATION SIGNALING PATHWAY 2-like [Potentilla anserina]